MALTYLKIRNAKPKDKSFKLFDSGGLFLIVPKSGNKSWRFKFKFNLKEQLIVIGGYPLISLSEAREEYRL